MSDLLRQVKHFGKGGTVENAVALIRDVVDVLESVRDLHKPRWDNCINACCSGEQCRNRYLACAAGCDDEWPCDTARLVYDADELDPT